MDIRYETGFSCFILSTADLGDFHVHSLFWPLAHILYAPLRQCLNVLWQALWKGSGVTCLGWFWEERKIPGLAMGEFLGDSYSLFWSYIDTYALYEFLFK